MTPSSTSVRLSVAHALQIETIRQRYHHHTSSHAFNTLYIWRRFVGEELYIEQNMFTLKYRAKGENTWLFPCGDRDAAFRFVADHLHEPVFSLCYLSDRDAEWLNERFPGQFQISPSIGDSEYIVDRAQHISLIGKRYEKLRNKVNRAERDYRIETEPLNDSNVSEALRIVHQWRGNRPVTGELKMYGDEEDTEPLMEKNRLGISGILMRVDGDPFGVAAGFMLSEDTFDLFLAKESVRNPSLGYYLRRELMRMLPDTVKWINLEDDLDIEGLRTMKKQMIPDRMNDMWMAVHYGES